MAARGKGPTVDRRNFLKGAAVGAATLAANTDSASVPPVATRPPLGVPPMSPAAETEPPSDVEALAATERPGADFMVDVLKSLGFDYLCANPGTSFRGLHESI